MRHPDCPAWRYNNHVSYPGSLRAALTEILIELDAGRLDAVVHGPDTRVVHTRLFQELTELGYRYYAGHYRGYSGGYRACLSEYDVHPQGDTTTQYARSTDVGDRMEQLGVRIRRAITELDRVWTVPDWQLPPERKLTNIVALTCEIFSAFLLIHPYADGNGHAARFVMWALLMRYGYRPVRWHIDPRPPEPYVALLRSYRAGDEAPLQLAVIQAVSP